MALLACNSVPVVEARLSLPRLGAWHADLVLAAADGVAEGDAVTLAVLDDLTLTGTATKAAAFVDSLRVRVVGGAGGLGTTATAKAYRSAQVRAVVSDLLGDAGESLASDADATLLATLLPMWATFARSVGVELAALLRTVSPSSAYRVTTGGALWIGSESWPESDAEGEVVERDERTGRLVLACEAPRLLPGTTFGGDRIGDVEHVITPNAVETIAWIEA